MQYREWFFGKCDEPGLLPGPWTGEPDKIQFQDEATGMACLVKRAGLHLCGYVGVPPGHPFFGLGPGDCIAPGCGMADCYEGDHSVDSAVRVHGGLTYAAPCQEEHERGICHVADPGEPNLWWLGFDCAHGGD